MESILFRLKTDFSEVPDKNFCFNIPDTDKSVCENCQDKICESASEQ